MTRARLLAVAMPLLLAISGLPVAPAAAQVRQCVGADGGVVYTDRQCIDIGATERLVSPGAGVASGGARLHRGCARSVQDLVYELSNAIYASDVNQLANVYDWAGMSTSNGYRLMTRLASIAKRPLVDVQPMYSGGTDPYADIVEFDAETGQVISPPPRKPRLIGLRVEQTLANGSTPSRTVFGLRQYLGCWWVRL